MAKGQSLQDPFLNALRRERIPVSIYLVNGIKLQGQIESFDQFVILLKNTVSQMVYKHSISTEVPAPMPSSSDLPPEAEFGVEFSRSTSTPSALRVRSTACARSRCSRSAAWC